MTVPFNDGDLSYPDREPHGEVVVDHDEAFMAVCMAHFADCEGRQGWEIQNSILTRSETWGLVWRADILRPWDLQLARTDDVNRLICWGSADGIGTAFIPGCKPLVKPAVR